MHEEQKALVVQAPDARPKTVVFPRSRQVPYEQKRDYMLSLLGWDDRIVAGQVSESSRHQYVEDFFDYLRFAGNLQAALDSAIFSQWRTDLVERVYLLPDPQHSGQMLERQLSPNSINRMMAAVRHMMRDAQEKKLVPPGTFESFDHVRGVSVRALRDRLKPNARVYVSPQDMRRLTEEPDRERLIGLRDFALLHTFGNGPRVSEICAITRNRIHAKGRGYVVEVRGKNKTEYREVPLTHEAHRAVQAWLAARPVESPYVFTSFEGRGEDEHTRLTDKPISRQGAWQIINKYTTQLGLVGVKPHDLRRLVGTQLAKRDPRLGQLVLGHASIETFYKHYVIDEIPEDATENLY